MLLPALTGDFGVMPGHVPTVAQLRPGVVTGAACQQPSDVGLLHAGARSSPAAYMPPPVSILASNRKQGWCVIVACARECPERTARWITCLSLRHVNFPSCSAQHAGQGDRPLLCQQRLCVRARGQQHGRVRRGGRQGGRARCGRRARGAAGTSAYAVPAPMNGVVPDSLAWRLAGHDPGRQCAC